MFWAIIFTAALGSTMDKFQPRVSIGPFDTVQHCAAAAALGIGSPRDGLNDKHPDKDFRAACETSPELARHPGEKLYDLRELAALAGVPF